MKISAFEEYGLRCLVQIARDPERLLCIEDIAKAEGISSAYAGKLLYKLRKGGLLKSMRGARGGYRLALPAGRVSMARIMETLSPGPKTDQEICRQFPGQKKECVHMQGACSIRTVWHTIYKNIWSVLATTTLADLIREQEDLARHLANGPLTPTPLPQGEREQRRVKHGIA